MLRHDFVIPANHGRRREKEMVRIILEEIGKNMNGYRNTLVDKPTALHARNK